MKRELSAHKGGAVRATPTAGFSRSAESKKKTELESLVEVRGVEGAFEAGGDGFLLDSLCSVVSDAEAVAAASAIAAITSERIGTGLALGGLRWILLEFKDGKVIIAKRNQKIIAVVGSRQMLLGEVLAKLSTLVA
jgi:predicted regulator of Ras-like GTPase activity (Roadblock/LC7/MglB family)